ncbi:MAG: urea amidolyase family protein [Acidobacteria bacterium]|nr:urea amidolyase family protein [Acidobacteriota bacterium]
MKDFFELRSAGPGTVLVQLDDDPAMVEAVQTTLSQMDAVESATPGFDSVFVSFDPRTLSLEEITTALEAIPPPDRSRLASGSEIEIPVSIAAADAPDLDFIVEACGVGREELIEILRSVVLRGRFEGFLPGFVYLDGLPPRLVIERRTVPRTKVPAGSFAIAAGMAGFYPLASPAGWHILGRTPAALVDPERRPAKLLRPGDRISLRLCESMEEARSVWSDPRPVDRGLASAGRGRPLLRVERPGQMALIVDGSTGRRPFDAGAARAANLAVGNPEGAPVMEIAAVGPVLRFDDEAMLSWQGADPDISVDDSSVGVKAQFPVVAGSMVAIGPLREGLRGWLAVSGGYSHFGSGVLREGDQLGSEGLPARTPRIVPVERTGRTTIGVWPGPHPIDPDELQLLTSIVWTVTAEIDRTGVRLESPEISTGPRGVASCGMRAGSVQWHPGGQLVAMGPDHPVTGGYLQPFSIDREEIWKLAALRPGESVWFILLNRK